MFLRKEMTTKSGVTGDFITIDKVGNVSIDLENKKIRLTICPKLWKSEEYYKSEEGEPLCDLPKVNATIDLEDYDAIAHVLTDCLIESDQYADAEKL